MHIVLIASEPLKEALFFTGLNVGNNITWLKNINELNKYTDADAFLDLDFEYDEIRITMLTQLLPKTVIINSVIHCLKETNIDFIRINGWHTFLQSNLIEAS